MVFYYIYLRNVRVRVYSMGMCKLALHSTADAALFGMFFFCWEISSVISCVISVYVFLQ